MFYFSYYYTYISTSLLHDDGHVMATNTNPPQTQSSNSSFNVSICIITSSGLILQRVSVPITGLNLIFIYSKQLVRSHKLFHQDDAADDDDEDEL